MILKQQNDSEAAGLNKRTLRFTMSLLVFSIDFKMTFCFTEDKLYH